MTEKLQQESIIRLCKAFNYNMQHIKTKSSRECANSTIVHCWEYAGQDLDGAIELHDDGWVNIDVGGKAMAEGFIDEVINAQERSHGPNDSWDGGPKSYEVEIIATIRKTVKVEAFSEDEAIETAHGVFSVLNDGDDEAYNQETNSVTRVEND